MFYSENIKITRKGIIFTDKHGKRLPGSEACRRALVRFYNWWLDFKLLVVNFVGHCPFWAIRKLVYLMAGVRIGRGSKIHIFCRFFEPCNIIIGQDAVVGEFAFLDGRAKLKIGNHTDIASGVMIYNSEHDIHDPWFRTIEKPVEISDYVFIGPRAIILPGVKIGRGAVVAAGAVVTKSVSAGRVVAGVPAEVIGERRLKKYQYRLGRTRAFQ